MSVHTADEYGAGNLGPEEVRSLRDEWHKYMQGESCGNLARWTYSDPARWENLIKETNRGKGHYFSPVEQNLLESSAEMIAKIIRHNEIPGRSVNTLLEWGPGTGEKIVPVVRSLENLHTVVFFDRQLAFMQEARNKVYRTGRPVGVQMHEQDFGQSGISAFDSGCLGLELGGTLFNIEGRPDEAFPYKKLQSRLRKLSEHFYRSGWILVTQHLGKDQDDILESYRGEHVANFVRGPLALAKKVFDIKGMNPDDFSYNPTYCLRNYLLAHFMKATRPMRLTMNDGTAYTLTADFMNAPINSYKPGEMLFVQCAASAGLEVVKTFNDRDHVLAIHLLRKETRRSDVHPAVMDYILRHAPERLPALLGQQVVNDRLAEPTPLRT